MTKGSAPYRRLADLLRDPRETLAVELKSWLDISNDRADRARLAKELIALANHGGGYVVIGFKQSDDGSVPAEPRPDNLAAYTPDTVNSVVSRYAEPEFHCDVSLETSAETGEQYPVITVPGGQTVPIRSRRSGPNEQIILADKYYIRRPGPKSEPPQNGREWDELIRRCLANARDELLDQFRVIMAGGAATEPRESDLEKLGTWFRSSEARWEELIADLPYGHRARMPEGHYASAYQIFGDLDPPAGADLLEALRHGAVRYTGWSPFWVPTREGIAPYLHEGNIECWLAGEGEDRSPVDADFWRVSPQAEFFIVRGYAEDSFEEQKLKPGKTFDIVQPTWQIGQVLLHAASMAKQLGDEKAKIVFMTEWRGLSGRSLVSITGLKMLMRQRYTSRQDTYSATLEVQADNIADSLPELVDRLVRPMYELFDFFDLPANLVSDELSRMRMRHYI